MNESIRLGDEMTRREIHAEFGGRLQGGISPTRGKNILLFIDWFPGRPHAEISADGTLHYIGEGVNGDQRFTQGNKALLHHKEDNKTLRAFQLLRGAGLCRYIGEFELDPEEPYRFVDQPGLDGQQRRAIEFHLRPIGAIASFASQPTDSKEHLPAGVEAPTDAPDSPFVRGGVNRAGKVAPRRFAELKSRFVAHVNSLGHISGRVSFPVEGGVAATADLFDSTTQTIYTVKSSSARPTVLSAIGQLLELRWLHGNASIGVVLPSRPYQDLLDLCTSLDIDIVWPDETTAGFVYNLNRLNSSGMTEEPIRLDAPDHATSGNS